MTTTPGPEIGKNLLKASYVRDEAKIEGGFAGIFGTIAGLYFQKYGDQSDALAMIAAKNHKNGVANPYAQMRKDFGFEFCRAESEKNPYVAGPLKRTDCSLVSDGAAALVLTDAETAKKMGKAINFRATAHAQDFLPMSKRAILQFEGGPVAWQRALQKAGVTLNDLSFVETHDCFTVAELIEYEAMGLTPKGQGFRAVKEGWTDLVIDQQPWLQGYLPILQICLTEVYGFSGMMIDTGAGFADKDNVEFLAPFVEKEIR
jgi:acetyl-CoA C-acetyltransferase